MTQDSPVITKISVPLPLHLTPLFCPLSPPPVSTNYSPSLSFCHFKDVVSVTFHPPVDHLNILELCVYFLLVFPTVSLYIALLVLLSVLHCILIVYQPTGITFTSSSEV